MNARHIVLGLAVAVVLAAAPFPAAGQAPTQNEVGAAPAARTPWGTPDLTGVWDFRTLTPFERPKSLAEQAFFSDEEADEFESDRLAEFAVRDDKEPDDIVGNYNQFWFDPGSKVGETNRTSLVVDPPTGRVPPLTPEAQEKRATRRETRKGVGPHMPTPRWLRRRSRLGDARRPMHSRVQLGTTDGARRGTTKTSSWCKRPTPWRS